MLYFLKSMSVKEPHVAYPHISCTIPSTIFPAFCGSSNDCRLEAESCSWSSESSEGSWWIQGMMGSIVKRVLSRHLGVKPQNIFHCTIMPCYDRKLEAAREDLRLPGLPATPLCFSPLICTSIGSFQPKMYVARHRLQSLQSSTFTMTLSVAYR